MTLAELINRWRNKLDDNKEPYGWSDAELAEYGADTIEELCEECHLINEFGIVTGNITASFASSTKKITRTTGSFLTDGFRVDDEIHTTSSNNPGNFTISAVSALEITVNEALTIESSVTVNIGLAISTFFVYEDVPAYDVDERITRIESAILTSETTPLTVLRDNGILYLGQTYSDWRNADSNTPLYLATKGFGEDRVRLFYTPDDDNAALMTVYRVPRNRMSLIGADISFTASTKTIARTAGGFGAAGFKAGHTIKILGSKSNDGVYTIASMTDTAIVTTQTQVDETISNVITILNLSATPEIASKHQKRLDNGVISKAYAKNDADYKNVEASEKHRLLFEKDIEDIKRGGIDETASDTMASPMLGNV